MITYRGIGEFSGVMEMFYNFVGEFHGCIHLLTLIKLDTITGYISLYVNDTLVKLILKEKVENSHHLRFSISDDVIKTNQSPGASTKRENT